ncbi:hypothetical protein KW790_00100 [Candidatus Parcubacteria bacterium]|nr:hypothetical protein [Candidatus Parcubacteria bacterium]
MNCTVFVPVFTSYFSDANFYHLTEESSLRLDRLWEKLAKPLGLWKKTPKLIIPSHGDMARSYALKLVDRHHLDVSMATYASTTDVRSECLNSMKLRPENQKPLIFFFGGTAGGYVEDILSSFQRSSAIVGYDGEPVRKFLSRLINLNPPLALILKLSDCSTQVVDFEYRDNLRTLPSTLDSELGPATVT